MFSCSVLNSIEINAPREILIVFYSFSPLIFPVQLKINTTVDLQNLLISKKLDIY